MASSSVISLCRRFITKWRFITCAAVLVLIIAIGIIIAVSASNKDDDNDAERATQDFCDQKSPGYHGDPLDCSKFYECRNGDPIARRYQCPDGKMFDVTFRVCLVDVDNQCTPNAEAVKQSSITSSLTLISSSASSLKSTRLPSKPVSIASTVMPSMPVASKSKLPSSKSIEVSTLVKSSSIAIHSSGSPTKSTKTVTVSSHVIYHSTIVVSTFLRSSNTAPSSKTPQSISLPVLSSAGLLSSKIKADASAPPTASSQTFISSSPTFISPSPTTIQRSSASISSSVVLISSVLTRSVSSLSSIRHQATTSLGQLPAIGISSQFSEARYTSTKPSTSLQQIPPSVPPTSPTTEALTTPSEIEFCAERLDGTYPVPNKCANYYQCFRGARTFHVCPAGLYYNHAVKVCDWPHNVDCDGSSQGGVTTPQGPTESPAPTSCEQSNCTQPACYCQSKSIPMGLKKSEVPQMVLLTFDDAVNMVVDPFFKQIFSESRLNPNGCRVTGTFFLSNGDTDYSIVRRLASEGHEIADHSCNHVGPKSEEEWNHEIMCQKNNIEVEGRTDNHKVAGWRSPFLLLGGDVQFKVLYDNGFKYDSSIGFSHTDEPYWPFTLDYEYTGSCNVPPCPKGSYPGMFEFPLMTYKDKLGYDCTMFDGCFAPPATAQETFELFKTNFHRYYDTNKAPFPAYGHASFFVGRPYRIQGYLQFLEYIHQFNDVYIVSVEKAVDWMRNPTKLQDLNNFDPWKC